MIHARRAAVLLLTVFAIPAVAAFFLWNHRYTLNGDGLSYLDIASNTVKYGPGALINAFWSPLYPVLIATGLTALSPSREFELPVVHLIGFCVFLLANLTFLAFLREWNWRWLLPGEALLCWASFVLIRLHLVTPDLLVAAFVFAAAAICCRLQSRPSAGCWLFLGFLLGTGCYAKAPMLQISAILLGVLCIWPPDGGKVRKGRIGAIAVLLLTISPWLGILSVKLGRPSIGEMGKLVYVWEVNDLNVIDIMDGRAVAAGRPLHPPRRLLEKPLVMEFDGPIAGTYPLWYDPVYWCEGVTPRINLPDQWRNIKKNCALLMQGFTGWAWLAGCAAWLPCLRKTPRQRLWMFLWPLGVLAMYLTVHIEDQYIAPFLVIFLLGAMEAVRQTGNRAGMCVAAALIAIAIIYPVIGAYRGRGKKLVRDDNARAGVQTMLEVSNRLIAAGVRPGEKVATCGPSYDSYWARAAGVKIVAQIVDCDLARENVEGVFTALQRLGVVAVVAKDIPEDLGGLNWHPLGDTRYGRYVAVVIRWITFR